MSRPPPEWFFYHLSRSAAVRSAPALLQKCLEAGWRSLVVSPNVARLAELDAALWTFDEASFLPHGQSGAPGLPEARQPILLSSRLENTNGAEALMLLDGAAAPVDAGFRRCLVLFEDADETARSSARAQYKAAREAGLVARYFQQAAGGGWKEQS